LRKGQVAQTQSDAESWDYYEGDPIFPLICLVISGAHSELVLVRGHGQYELLGQPRDDAAGGAFDKVAVSWAWAILEGLQFRRQRNRLKRISSSIRNLRLWHVIPIACHVPGCAGPM